MNALEVRGISKAYPGVRALDQIAFACSKGSVHALVGENGAGKSTLIKILSSAIAPDEGELLLDGEPYAPESPGKAAAAGVSTIYQEFNLIPGLNVAENIFLGRERVGGGLLESKSMRHEAQALLERIGAPIDVRRRVGTLSVAEQQLVEIAKSLAVSARVLIMDEPSATLSDHEMTLLYNVVRKLSSEGVTIIYVSHRLDEIFDLCDTCTVMKDGRSVCTRPVAELNRESLIRLMVGRELDTRFPEKRPVTTGEIVLEVEGLRLEERVRDMTFSVRAGEVVGLAGLVGAGRTEVARAIFGLEHRRRPHLVPGPKPSAAISVAGYRGGHCACSGRSQVARTRAGLEHSRERHLAHVAQHLPVRFCRKPQGTGTGRKSLQATSGIGLERGSAGRDAFRWQPAKSGLRQMDGEFLFAADSG